MKMWEHIPYAKEHFDEMLAMTQEYYGNENDISQRDFVVHEYFENPAGEALIDLAWDAQANTLAGQYVVLPMRFLAYGEEIQCSLSLNTLTRENYRGQGVFTGLAERTYAHGKNIGHKFCYGMPNPNSYPGFIKKLQFKDIGNLPLYLRPLHPSRMVQEFFGKKFMSVFARPLNPIYRIKSCSEVNEVQVVPLTEENISLVDGFWSAVAGKYPIMNVRDSAFVRFRYLAMPRRTYIPMVALRAGAVVAFAVGRTTEVAGMQCAMLVDFLFLNGEEIAGTQLLKVLLSELQARGASVAGSLMLQHTQEAALLRHHGFFRCPKKLEPQPFPFILRSFNLEAELKKMSTLSNWFFTMGDYDVI